MNKLNTLPHPAFRRLPADRASLQQKPNLPAATQAAMEPSISQPHPALLVDRMAFRPADFAMPAMQPVPAPAAQPLVFPASNHPAMWQALGPIIQQSPMLRSQLDSIARAGWKIDWAPGNAPACFDDSKTIYMTTNSPPLTIVQTLAHEVRHAFQGQLQPWRSPTDRAFGEHMVFNVEAEAVLNQLQVRREILSSSGIDIGIMMQDPEYYQAALAFYERHGDLRRVLNHLGMHYGWIPSGQTGTPYWEATMNTWRARAGLPPISLPPEMADQGREAAKRALAAEIQADDMQRVQALQAAQMAQVAQAMQNNRAAQLARVAQSVQSAHPSYPARQAQPAPAAVSRSVPVSAKVASTVRTTRPAPAIPAAQPTQATPATLAIPTSPASATTAKPTRTAAAGPSPTSATARPRA